MYGALPRLGSVGVASGLFPTKAALSPSSKCFPNRLTGISTGTLHRSSVELLKKLIEPVREIIFIVLTVLDHRSQQEDQQQPSLIQLTGFHSAMISVRFWIGITRDPVTVFSTQFRQVIVPVRAQSKGITNQCANYSAGSTI